MPGAGPPPRIVHFAIPGSLGKRLKPRALPDDNCTAEFQVRTGVRTRRAFRPCLAHMTLATMRVPCSHATWEGAYGIRTLAGARVERGRRLPAPIAGGQ